MRILNIMTCFNEVDDLPFAVEFYKEAGIDLFVLDNGSTDDSFEWLKEHEIPCEKIKNDGIFHLTHLQEERKKILDLMKPDWIIFGNVNEFIFTPNIALNEVIEEVDRKGFNQIKCRKLEFFNTGELVEKQNKKKHPRETYFYYEEVEESRHEGVRICKYQEENEFAFETILAMKPKECTIEGYVLNFERTKPKEVREVLLQRRKNAWRSGLIEPVGSYHNLDEKKNWKWNKDELQDVRNFEPLRKFIDAT